MPSFTAKEWDASGAIYCYGKMELRCFVVEVDVAEAVNGELLQAAVEAALERMPYYRQTLVRKKGLYYYASNDLPFLVAELEQARPVGGPATNYHMVDVTYFGNTLRFAMHHGFCDGLGLNRLIEATLYHYHCLKDNKEYASDGIITKAVPYDAAEEYDAFAIKTDADPADLKKLSGDEERLRLPELGEPGTQGPTMYRFPLRVKTQDLLGWCKACGSSPAAALSAFAAVAAERELHPTGGVIRNVLPMSLRNFLGAEKTFKNCSAAAFLSVTSEEARTVPVPELATQLRGRLKEQMGDGMGVLLSASINMVTHLGKKLPFFFLKTKVFSIPQTRPQDTFYVDYVGRLTTPGYEDQIREVRYLNADPCGGSTFILMNEAAGYFHISLSQTFDSDRYRKALCAVLEEQNIAYELEEAGTYLNPSAIVPPEQR